jgi:catechol 2,3-dioxygenase-like lactoylglutathione lyase family enzyme
VSVRSPSALPAEAHRVHGRFLEISLATADIAAAVHFYEHIGFHQVPVNDIWPHRYAVLTDGRLWLGLHETVLPSPLLTFVQPELQRRLSQLQATGMQFASTTLGNAVFNEASFIDPHGCHARFIEARTFALDAERNPHLSDCGYFSEFALPVREFEAGRNFWERLDFIALEEVTAPIPRVTLTSAALNLALYRSRAFRQPMLVFEDEHMAQRISKLRGKGLQLTDEMPDVLDADQNAVLLAPDGIRILLLQSKD